MTAAFHLRRATPTDAGAIGVVHVEAWREAYRGLFPPETLARLDPARRAEAWRGILLRDTSVHLAEMDHTLVGFGASGTQRDQSLQPFSGEITALYVLQRAQRLGIGRALMGAMVRDLLAQGHSAVALWVVEGNAPARRFYETLGGRIIARREQRRDGVLADGIAYGWDELNRLAA